MGHQARPRVRRGFLLVVAASVGGLLLAAVIVPVGLRIFRSWLLAPDSCTSPCNGDLGLNWAEGHGYPSAIPTCKPAELRIELHETKIKRGARYPLWYRATLKNTSCFKMTTVLANFLIHGPEFKIFDSQGVEVPPNARYSWNDVIPYSYDRQALAAMEADPTLKLGVAEGIGPPLWFMHLPPGRSVTGLPSKLEPSLNWLQPHGFSGKPLDFSVRDKTMRPIIEGKLKGEDFAEPPKGFAVVEGYVLRTPGKYRIQAEAGSEFRQVMLYSRFERYRRHVPEFIHRAFELSLNPAYAPHMRPMEDSLVIYSLKLESNSVDFEVIP